MSPRFLPNVGYEVNLPRALNPGFDIWPTRFHTLALAKAAVESWSMQDWMRESDNKKRPQQQFLENLARVSA